MGDRTGLKKLDRTNGYEDGSNYVRVKQSKLAQQNDQIRDAIRQRSSTSKSDLFKGISISVNGRTQPTADELKRLILLNGGDYHPYYRYQTTKFMIATNLSMARIKQLRPDDRIVRPEWITDSIQVNCLLPYEDYQLFDEEPRGRNGKVLAIDMHDNDTTNSASSDHQQLVPVSDSYSRSYRDSRQRANQQKADASKSRDIREMFSKSVRSISSGSGVKQNRVSDVISITDSSLEDSGGGGSKMNIDADPTDSRTNGFQDDEHSSSPNQRFEENDNSDRELIAKLAKPMKIWDPKIDKIQSNLNGIIKQISDRIVDEDRPYYVLLQGRSGAGLTTIAANMASTTDFPYVRFYQAKATAGKTENAKVEYMEELFYDAAQYDMSCIVFDGLEMIMNYCSMGPRYSNTSRTVFRTNKDLTLPEGHRMLIICTCNPSKFLTDLCLEEVFDDIIYIPSLMKPDQVIDYIKRLLEIGESPFTFDQIEELRKELIKVQFIIGIKKLERLIKNATRDSPEERVKMFCERMYALGLTY